MTKTRAREARAAFVHVVDGRYALKHDAPEWVRDLVRKAHGEMLPSAWRYKAIVAALEAIGAGETDADAFADDLADVYTSDLLKWLASNTRRVSYCDAAAGNFPVEGGIIERIRKGQYAEAVEVFELVMGALDS